MNKDLDIVPEEARLVLLDSKSSVCMAKDGKDTKHTKHIEIIFYFVRNGENCKMHKIDWCEGGLKLADIVTKNFVENDLNPRKKYIMIRLENWDRALVQEGWHSIR